MGEHVLCHCSVQDSILQALEDGEIEGGSAFGQAGVHGLLNIEVFYSEMYINLGLIEKCKGAARRKFAVRCSKIAPIPGPRQRSLTYTIFFNHIFLFTFFKDIKTCNNFYII